MLCVIPFFSGDKDQAIRLANWIRHLGGVKHHDCLLVIDTGTTETDVIEPLHEAFSSVATIKCAPVGSQGTWGSGTTDATAANEMWLAGANCVFHRQKVPFFWLEPDAVPTRSTWLDEIEAEYKTCGKRFMGAFVDIPPHEQHMSGVSVYPADVANHSVDMMQPGQIAWDYAGRNDTVVRKKANFTNLIQHEYRIDGEAPTFPTIESMSVIRPETAVFHRCKNDSLVQRLREQEVSIRGGSHKMLLATDQDPFAKLAIANARIAELEKQLAIRSVPISENIASALPIKPHYKTQLRKGNPMKSKRTLSPERKAQLVEAMTKARAAKKEKSKK